MDENAPVKKRWRLVAWAIAAVVLVPVLYVAAAGPAAWWSRHHYHSPAWMDAHAASLKPLYQHPQTRAALDQYMRWWFNRPVPRSWRRQMLVERIERLKQDIAVLEILEREAGEDAKSEALEARAKALGASEETAAIAAGDIQRLLGDVSSASVSGLTPLPPAVMAKVREAFQADLQRVKKELRQFDAQ